MGYVGMCGCLYICVNTMSNLGMYVCFCFTHDFCICLRFSELRSISLHNLASVHMIVTSEVFTNIKTESVNHAFFLHFELYRRGCGVYV